MNIETITTNYLQTISWLGDKIVDWASAGKVFFGADKDAQFARYHYAKFDGVVVSKDNRYVFVYKRLGTKGLLLKDGELLREVNRSYYCAEAYEYPAAFVTIDDVVYLVHCPLQYCRIDLENVETGELITDVPGRDPHDVFYSRLEISPGSTYLMSRGWFWHPLDVVDIFNIADCIQNPLLLDRADLSTLIDVEINTASFIDDARVLIGSTDEVLDDEAELNIEPKHIGVWDLRTDKITSTAKVNGEFGNLFAINERYAWDMLKYPKIIEIATGEIVDKDETVFSGKQRSSMMGSDTPKLAYNRHTKQMAIAHENTLTILSTDIR